MTIIQKAWSWVTNIFNKADDEAKILVPIAIKIVNGLKVVMESPADNALVYLIDFVTKGIVDPVLIQKIYDTIKSYLPKVLTDLTLINSIANITDPNAQLQAILAALKLSSNAAQNTLYHGLCSLILQDLSGGKLTFAEAVSISQYYYTNFVATPAVSTKK